MRIRHALLISVMALKLIVVLPAVGGVSTSWSRDMRKLIECGSHPIAHHVMLGHRQTGCWLASAYALVRSVRLRGGEEGTGVDESGEGVSGDDSDIEDEDDNEDTLSSVMAQQDEVLTTDDGASASHHSDRQRWRSSAGVGGEAGASAKRGWPEEHAGMHLFHVSALATYLKTVPECIGTRARLGMCNRFLLVERIRKFLPRDK